MSKNYHIDIKFPGNTIEQQAMITALADADVDFPYELDRDSKIVAREDRRCTKCKYLVYKNPRLGMHHIIAADKQFNAKVKVEGWIGGDKCR